MFGFFWRISVAVAVAVAGSVLWTKTVFFLWLLWYEAYRAEPIGSSESLYFFFMVRHFETPTTRRYPAVKFSLAVTVVCTLTAVDAIVAVAVAVPSGAAFIALVAAFVVIAAKVVVIFTIGSAAAVAVAPVIVSAVALFTAAVAVVVVVVAVVVDATVFVIVAADATVLVIVFADCCKDAESVVVEETTVSHLLHSIIVGSSIVGVTCVPGVTGVVGAGKMSQIR